jgi:hypothetical protein
MTMSNSRLSYEDCYDLMTQALNTPLGSRAWIGSREAAYTYRLKLNKARALDRKLNAEAFPQGHKMHGGSEFDELMFKIRQDENGEFWVYLEKALAPTHVEAIEPREAIE